MGEREHEVNVLFAPAHGVVSSAGEKKTTQGEDWSLNMLGCSPINCVLFLAFQLFPIISN